jgi:hypothetical protein
MQGRRGATYGLGATVCGVPSRPRECRIEEATVQTVKKKGKKREKKKKEKEKEKRKRKREEGKRKKGEKEGKGLRKIG